MNLKNNNIVSVIMPAYNSEKYLRSAVGSVQAQSYTNWELIIINDASTDKTEEIANKLAAEDDRIKVISLKQNGGIANARNTGMKAAEGRYLAFLDSDDLWVEDKLEKQLEFMRRGNYRFVFSAYGIMNDSGEKYDYIRQVPQSVSYNQLLKVNVIATSSVVLDRCGVKPFTMPQRKHEDYSTWLGILRTNGISAYGINEPLEYYRKSDNSVSRNKWKTLSWTFKVYHDGEGFNVVKSAFCLFRFIVNTIKKYCQK